MLPGLSDLDVPVLGKVLRRTVLTSLGVGLVAVGVALVVSEPFAALGIAVGIGVAIINLRFLDAGVAKVDATGETNTKMIRRALGARTATRLLVITGIAIGLMFLNGPMGIGMVTGLVIFQIAFVANVGKVIASAGVL